MSDVVNVTDSNDLKNITKSDNFTYHTLSSSINTIAQHVAPPPTQQTQHFANADTGTTGHYIAMKDMNCLQNVRTVAPHERVTVVMPTGEEIHSTHTGELNFSQLPQGQRVHVFEHLWGSLLGIGDLCDIGLTAVFDRTDVYIVDTECEQVVLTGKRDPKTRLWMIAMQPITKNQEKRAVKRANAIQLKRGASDSVTSTPYSDDIVHQEKQSTCPETSTPLVVDLGNRQAANAISAQKLDCAGDKVEFFSRVFCSAAESTLINAVKKGWIRYPGITCKTLKRHRHRLRTHASAAGHLDQIHQNHKPAHRADAVPASEDKDLAKINIVTYVYEEKNHLDATGRFPAISHRGHQYVLIMYSEGGNYIKAIPMKKRTKESYLTAHKEGVEYFQSRGYQPTCQRMDNEISNDFCAYLRKHGINIDLAPPHQHRRNKAERAIRTFKNHFIATLAGVDPAFPICAWNELLEHVEITLNLLRPSEVHPRQSAWEAMNGAYDYDAHPLAPPGTAVTVHEKPDQRSSWGKHGVPGFYVGPAMNHYRCYTVWVTHTGSVRYTDTLAWHPHGYQWEVHSPVAMVSEIAESLAAALHHLATHAPQAAANTQPMQAIAQDIAANFRALQHLYNLPAMPTPTSPVTTVDPPDTQRVQSTGTADPAPPQRVPLQACEDPAPSQRVPLTASEDTQPPQRVAAAGPESQEAREAATPRHSSRRKHRWLNRANAAAKKASKSSRTKPQATRRKLAFLHRANAAVKGGQSIITRMNAWGAWAKTPGVALDSTGRPFFLATPCEHQHFANTAVDLDDKGQKLSMTTALASKEGDIWLAKHGEEIARLFDSGTISLIQRNEVPDDKKPAYYNPQVRTKIKDGALQYRVRGTIGGNHIDYAGDTAAHTASMQLIKILLNAVVSDKGSKFMTADIKDFYLGTPLPSPEYMRINLQHIPQDVINKYGMSTYAHNGAVIVRVDKGIYGLPQAGILAQDRLVKHLASHGYHQAKHTPCLFKHESNSVAFTLVVDDFGIKYTREADADHLMSTLRKLYIMTEDRATKQKYVGITIEHDLQNRTIYLTMPGYVHKAIVRFGHAKNPGAKSPLIYVPPLRGPEQQLVPDLSPESYKFVDAKTKTFVQEVTGVFLFYSRAVDPTMLTAVNKISSEQSNPTEATLKAVDRLLSYAERYPDATIIIKASNMQLCAQSDASYLSETKARSRAGGMLYFGLTAEGAVNGAIDYISMIIPTICSSVAEAEYAALFLVGRAITSARHILEDLGYSQLTTTIVCDNSCAVGLANNTVKQKQSKAIDMRYHWTRDQVSQGKFKIRWEAGAGNLADYFTKAHPVHHYVNMRRTYVYTPKPTSIRDCARSRRVIHRVQKST